MSDFSCGFDILPSAFESCALWVMNRGRVGLAFTLDSVALNFPSKERDFAGERRIRGPEREAIVRVRRSRPARRVTPLYARGPREIVQAGKIPVCEELFSCIL